MKIWIVKETWRLDNESRGGDMHLALDFENAKTKFLETKEKFQDEFREWYGEKDAGNWDGDWQHLKNWNITDDSDTEFTCTNSDYESESVEIYSQETID